MGEEEAIKTEEKKPASYFSYLPYVLGLAGLTFIGIGLFFTFYKKPEPTKITFSDSTSNPSDLSIPSNPSGLMKILVDVSGAVEKPGVYEIAADGRYRDALAAAGGLSVEADREYVDKYINLAAKLVDGGKIYIPKVNEESNKAQGTSDKLDQVAGISVSGLININTASLSELDTLSGVGPVTAQKIIDGRPYQKIEDLIEKKIVGNSVWEKIKEKISVY